MKARDDAADLIVAVDLEPLAAAQEVDGLHPLGQVARAARPRAASSSAFAATVIASPTTMISACSSLIGALIVTGVTISRTAIAARSAAVDGEHAPEERDACVPASIRR